MLLDHFTFFNTSFTKLLEFPFRSQTVAYCRVLKSDCFDNRRGGGLKKIARERKSMEFEYTNFDRRFNGPNRNARWKCAIERHLEGSRSFFARLTDTGA